MARVAISEYGLTCEECLIEAVSPPPSFSAINPMGQVPALVDGIRVIFPTCSVLEHLASSPDQQTSQGIEVTSKLQRPKTMEEALQLFTVIPALNNGSATAYNVVF